MAGEQDILSLGLDISQFNTQKKAILTEYLALFDKLSKYDGKVFNPIAGDGLTKFNISIQETNKLLTEINTKMYGLVLSTNTLNQSVSGGTSALNAEANAINNLGRATTNTTTGFRLMNTAHDKFIVNTYASRNSIEGLGKSLTSLLTNLRYIAFILPGLGIAGIFNLAYTAIANAASAIFDFKDSEEKLIETQNKVNDALRSTINNFKEIIEAQIRIASLQGSPYTGLASEKNVQDQENLVNLIKAEGIEKKRVLETELELAKAKTTNYKLGFINANPEQARKEINTRTNDLIKLKVILDAINQAQATGNGFLLRETKLVKSSATGELIERQQQTLITSKSKIEDLKKSYQGSFDLQNSLLKDLNEKYKNYYDSLQVAENKKQELIKFNSDQERSILVETTRNNINANLKAQQDTLSNDKKFYDEKKAAIIQQYKDEVALAENNRIQVTGVLKQDVTKNRGLNINVSATKADIVNAFNKQNNEIKEADIKLNKDLEKNETEFYQRHIKALIDININEVKSDSDKNKAIFENQQKSLSERLVAYSKFIEDEQLISNRQYAIDIQRGASGPGGKTSLTPDEANKIISDNAKRKEQIIADSEKRVYDIIHSSLEKILSEVKEENDINDTIDKENHIRALENLNKQYEDKKISIKDFRKKKKQIEYDFDKQDLDQQIKNDQAALDNLKETLFEKIQAELEYRKQQLKIATAGGNPEEIRKAQAAVNAAQDAVNDAAKAITASLNKLADDRLRRAALNPPDDAKEWQKWSLATVRIINHVLNEIRRLYDERIEMEIQFIEKRQQLLDQQYGNEENAIEKSSLSLKDKQALEIQIQAEKQVSDENAVREEINLKIKRFEFDKKIALAEGAIGIAALIIKDGLKTPAAIADAIIGAAQIAAILAQQPPSFAEGVLDFVGGIARYGEAGPEAVKEPNKPLRIVSKETISYLPKGTDIIPLTQDHPEFGGSVIKDESWNQTKFLAKQIKKNNKEIVNIFKPIIIINSSFEQRKNQILGT